MSTIPPPYRPWDLITPPLSTHMPIGYRFDIKVYCNSTHLKFHVKNPLYHLLAYNNLRYYHARLVGNYYSIRLENETVTGNYLQKNGKLTEFSSNYELPIPDKVSVVHRWYVGFTLHFPCETLMALRGLTTHTWAQQTNNSQLLLSLCIVYKGQTWIVVHGWGKCGPRNYPQRKVPLSSCGLLPVICRKGFTQFLFETLSRRRLLHLQFWRWAELTPPHVYHSPMPTACPSLYPSLSVPSLYPSPSIPFPLPSPCRPSWDIIFCGLHWNCRDPSCALGLSASQQALRHSLPCSGDTW